MRTTLTIDDDVLRVVQERARRERRTAGQVLSDLERQALAGPRAEAASTRNGFPVLLGSGCPVSDSTVEELREQEGV